MVVFALVSWRSGTRGHGRAGAGLAIGVLSLVSFAWAVNESRYAAETAYISTFARVWELGVGAGLAVAAPLVARPASARSRSP
jgi:peptidoglycan/LPS O-acetylase OafA/YrhL